MRRGRKNTQADEADVDMTPMLDIVFIMLIFFIVTATFLDETAIDLTQPPPPPDTPNPPDAPRAITVFVDARNQCSVDERRTNCDRVTLAVERLLADKPGASVILRLDERAQHKILVELKDGLDAGGRSTKIEIIKAGEA
ncbi:outer membrane transport energization protein ExbD [Litorimonas taeanensis]|uniref:Outer membrane transport energization protein ExbD n=1 Tax=Litorimonas taeanensis TaxID=568099 RepID=A0A420WIW5_9PROT|nr:biopolymer transporter ExbD [Litorimonas taeanensis]RKQ70879.1 outer membrane transport energization protein ExbD [Litorimonas taeanensis]